MREKVISWFAYLWAGLTGVASGLSMNEIGVLISIFATVFTAFINWFYRHRTLKEERQDTHNFHEPETPLNTTNWLRGI